jgi:SAM-dependent methyltransferase
MPSTEVDRVSTHIGRDADIQPHYGLQIRVLEALASARRYNEWVATLTLPHLGEDPLEIGSGLGEQASVWLEQGVTRITLSDLETRSVEALQRRFDGDERVGIRRLDLANCQPAGFSSVVATNVLEHIEDDVAALERAGSLVRPEGRVVVFVPAFPFAMSRFDRELGHYRRYTTRTLTQRLTQAGLDPLTVQYVNAPGLFAWVVGMKLLRLRPSGGALERAWDRIVVPAARRLEGLRPPPFGQSIFAVSTRPAA